MFEDTLSLLDGDDFGSDITGSQLYVSVNGEGVLNTAVGACGRTASMTAATKLLWLCCGKPMIIITLCAILDELGLDEDLRVASVLPEFAHGGKGDVTLAHVLTHTVPYEGFGESWVDGGYQALSELGLMSLPWDAAVGRICDTAVKDGPGSRVVYTVFANWLMLAEVIQRLTGRDYEEAVRARVLEPLGMTATLLALSAPYPEPALAPMWETGPGTDPARYTLDSPALFGGRWPGIGARGCAEEMARPFECIGGWRSPELLSDAYRAKITTARRAGLSDPLLLGTCLKWSLGLCVDPLLFGLPAGTRIVGSTGIRSSLGSQDLAHGVTISFISSNMVPASRDWTRKRRLIRTIYRELGEGAR